MRESQDFKVASPLQEGSTTAQEARSKRSRSGRVVRQRRRKAAEIRRQAQDAIQNFLQGQVQQSSQASTAATNEMPGEDVVTRPASHSSNSRKNDDRARVLPAVAELRRQQTSNGRDEAAAAVATSAGWDDRVEVLLASQLGYVPGNAIRVSCFQSEVECLNRVPSRPIQQQNAIIAMEGENDPSSGPHTTSPAAEMRNLPAPEQMRDVPVAIELYPLAIRDDTTTATNKSPRRGGRNGKPRRRKLHTTPSDLQSSEPIDAVHNVESSEEKVNNDTSNGNDEVLEPFPTLYWVTHPLLRVLISQLEVEGWVRRFEERLRNDCVAQESMQTAHAKYGAYRDSLLSPDDRQLLQTRKWESALCPESRGVAGIRFSGTTGPASSEAHRNCCAVKCLHAHAAHYLSATSTNTDCNDGATTDTTDVRDNGGNDNVVGKWVMELMESRLQSLSEGMPMGEGDEVAGIDKITGNA